jgi:hypothetical protein
VKILRQSSNSGSFYLNVFAFAIGALPIVCVIWLIYSSSVNAPTNDYVDLTPRIGKMLEAGYDWTKFPRDCSQSSHCYLLPMLVHLLNIFLFKWNVTLELYLGLVLCLIRVVLLDKMLCPGKRTGISAVVMIAIYGLSFGASNVAVLLYNLTAIAYGIAFLSFILGLYALYLFDNSKKGLLLMLLCGFAASFSHGGSAIFSWISYSLYIAVHSAKNRLAGLLTCLIGLALSASSISFLIHSGGIQKATLHPHLPDVRMYLQCFALPFLRQTILPYPFTNQGTAIGVVGFLTMAILLLVTVRRRLVTKTVCICLALAAFATMNIFAATLFRSYVAPWYGSFAALFWIAIIGISINLVDQRGGEATEDSSSARKKGLSVAVMALPICFVYVAFFCSNLTYRDKDSFCDSHCPASASAMTNFATCPTYGEANLFSFTIGSYERVAALAEPLARHGLACFQDQRLLSLQGDWLFPQVRTYFRSKHSEVHWIAGQSMRKSHEWNEPQHLNLALIADTTVVWPVTIPVNSTEALFSTKFSCIETKKSKSKENQNQLAHGEISIFDSKTSKVLFNKPLGPDSLPIVVDLKPYGGQSLAIKFCSTTPDTGADSALIFEWPTIKIKAKLDPGQSLAGPVIVKPANTELSPAFRGPGSGDYIWPLDPALWDLEGLDRIAQDNTSNKAWTLKATKALSSVTYKPALSIPINSVDRFYIEISVPAKVTPRAVCCQMVINGSYLRQIFMPLLGDGRLHRYTYDLKLCNLNCTDTVTGFKVLPIFTVEPGADCNISIGNIAFLKP